MGAFQIVLVYYGLLIGSRPIVLWNIIAVAPITISPAVSADRHELTSPEKVK